MTNNVSTWDLVTLNLGSPAVLAFVLGVVAAVIRSDLRFPEQVTSFLSSYLLFAIGLKGGMRLREAEISELLAPAAVTVLLGLVTPVVAFVVGRRWLRLDHANAASIAAHYGSVSAVTFTAAETFARSAGTLEEGFMPALVAVLEVPGIVIALVLAGTAAGLSAGGATVLGTMAASASYIAAPAAVRVGLPEADVGYALGAALGVTFPFNLVIGVPLCAELASLPAG